MYIRRSEDVHDIFWTSYVRSIYVLCLRACKTNFFIRPCFRGRNLRKLKSIHLGKPPLISKKRFFDSLTLVYVRLHSSTLFYNRPDSSIDSSTLIYIRLDSSSDSSTLVYIRPVTRLDSSTLVYARLVTHLCF